MKTDRENRPDLSDIVDKQEYTHLLRRDAKRHKKDREVER